MCLFGTKNIQDHFFLQYDKYHLGKLCCKKGSEIWLCVERLLSIPVARIRTAVHLWSEITNVWLKDLITALSINLQVKQNMLILLLTLHQMNKMNKDKERMKNLRANQNKVRVNLWALRQHSSVHNARTTLEKVIKSRSFCSYSYTHVKAANLLTQRQVSLVKRQWWQQSGCEYLGQVITLFGFVATGMWKKSVFFKVSIVGKG